MKGRANEAATNKQAMELRTGKTISSLSCRRTDQLSLTSSQPRDIRPPISCHPFECCCCLPIAENLENARTLDWMPNYNPHKDLLQVATLFVAVGQRLGSIKWTSSITIEGQLHGQTQIFHSSFGG